jgi:long-chain acyl-CoA synthetase
MLFKNLTKFKSQIAIIEDETVIKYSDLIADLQDVCKKIDKKKKLFFILTENSYDFIKLYISLIKLGNVVFLVDIKIDQAFLVKLVKDYKPNYLCVPKTYDYKKKNNCFNIDSYEVIKISPYIHKFNSDLQLLLPTSGTTGSSKLVMLTKKNIYKNTADIIKYLKLNKDDKILTSLPFHYSYGLSILNTHLMSGGKIILFKGSMISKDFQNFFNKKKINCYYGVPENYEIIKRLNLKITKNFFKFFAIAGGKISKITLMKLLEIAEKFNFKIYNMYGQTEASPRISYSKYKKKRDRESIFTVGKAFGGGKIYIKKNGKILKKNEIGKIYYKGLNVMLGYAKSYKDFSKKRNNKFLIATGDLGFIDKNNNLNIVGRSDRYIKLDSERINLNQLEDLLREKFINNYYVVYMHNKLNIFSDDNKTLKMATKYLVKKTNIKRNYIKAFDNYDISYLSNGKVNHLKIKNYLLLNES